MELLNLPGTGPGPGLSRINYGRNWQIKVCAILTAHKKATPDIRKSLVGKSMFNLSISELCMLGLCQRFIMEYMRNITVIFSCYPSPAPALPVPAGSISDEISGQLSWLSFNSLGSNSCLNVFAFSVATHLVVQVGLRSLKILAEWPPPLPEIRLAFLDLSTSLRKISMQWPPPLPAIRDYISLLALLLSTHTGGYSEGGLSLEAVMVHVISRYCPLASIKLLPKRNSLGVGRVVGMNHLVFGDPKY
jgi:hypothetical protein